MNWYILFFGLHVSLCARMCLESKIVYLQGGVHVNALMAKIEYQPLHGVESLCRCGICY